MCLNGILKSRQSGDSGLNVKLMKANAVLIIFLSNKLIPDLSGAKNDMSSLRRSKMQTKVIFTTQKVRKANTLFWLDVYRHTTKRNLFLLMML